MITAKEAQVLTSNAQVDLAPIIRDTIECGIKREAHKGKHNVTFYGTLPEAIRVALIDMGYFVACNRDEIQHEDYYIIEW